MQLATMLIGMGILASVLYLDPRDLYDLRTLAGILGVIFIGICYLVGRLGHPRLSAGGLVAVTLAMFLLPPYVPSLAPHFLAFLIIPVLLTGMFFSLRWAISVAILIVGLTFVLNRVLTYVDFWQYQLLWYFLVMASTLVIILVRHQQIQEAFRTKALEDANRKLRQSESLLERRVEERTKALQAAYEEIQALNRLKDEFVSNVSHELRTPISSMKLQHYLLQKTSSEGQRSHLAVLHHEADRLEQLIESLLLLSRLDQDRTELHFKAVDLNALVASYVQDRTLLAETRHLTLHTDISVQPVLARADAGLLGQVLSILLTNALNYTQPGGSIAVRTAIQAADHRPWASFSIQDNGPGIPPEEQALLFSRFFRGQSARDTQASGTGLGLAIAKEIIDRHGDELSSAAAGRMVKGQPFGCWYRRLRIEGTISPANLHPPGGRRGCSTGRR